jgi:hypothetical protein
VTGTKDDLQCHVESPCHRLIENGIEYGMTPSVTFVAWWRVVVVVVVVMMMTPLNDTLNGT